MTIFVSNDHNRTKKYALGELYPGGWPGYLDDYYRYVPTQNNYGYSALVGVDFY